MRNLRTLALAHEWESECHTGGSEPLCAIHLDLQNQTQLTSVMLDDLNPAWIKLPRGTALHVVCKNLSYARSQVWHSVLGAMQTFALHARFEYSMSADDVPSFLLEENRLGDVVIDCY